MLTRRAIVVGGSIAGLFAARVLSNHFDQVEVLENDDIPSAAGQRVGVPHGKQTHVLLPSGAAVLERFFPGRVEELVASGAKRFDFGHSRYHLSGMWMPHVDTDLFSYALTRRLFEEKVRSWVSAIKNIRFFYGTRVSGLCFSPDRDAVTGVVLGKHAGSKGVMSADLIVDASGRGSAIALWLKAIGIVDIPEERIAIDMGYATGLFRTPPAHLPKSTLTYIVGRPPALTRAGNLFRVEDDLVCSGMAGYHGDYPPGDLAGFLDFAKSLPQPDIYEVLRHSELVAPLARFRAPASVRRLYWKVKRFPDGLLPIGDSIANFDPVFAQGMSLAAQEAAILDENLQTCETLSRLRKTFLTNVSAMLSVPWDLCCGENFKYPQTPGPRPRFYAATRTVKDMLGTSGDPEVTRDLYRVFTLTASPYTLLKPTTVVRALSAHAFGPSARTQSVEVRLTSTARQ